MSEKGERSSEDIEEGPRHSVSDGSDGDSLCYLDAEDHSWHLPNDSNRASSIYDGPRFSEAFCHDGIREPDRPSHVSDSSLEGELGSGGLEIKVIKSQAEQDCRICHLSLEKASPESDVPILLGCSCKGDLATAHKQCAETWFKIKGNNICEVCGSTARNMVGSDNLELKEQLDENNTSIAPPAHPSETRRFWQGHRLLNFLLVCLVFAFVVSWLFHFNIPG